LYPDVATFTEATSNVSAAAVGDWPIAFDLTKNVSIARPAIFGFLMFVIFTAFPSARSRVSLR